MALECVLLEWLLAGHGGVNIDHPVFSSAIVKGLIIAGNMAVNL